MTGTPAVMVGGQRRRRNGRPPNMPRSNTTPVLESESSTTADSASSVTAGLETNANRSEASYIAPTLEPLSTTMDFYPPTGGLLTNIRPSSTSRPSTPTAGSTTSTDSKKKHSFFGYKSRDQNRSINSHGTSLQPSLLPPSTPVKAAQLLGFDSGAAAAQNGSLGQQEDGYDSPTVRPMLTKQASMPMLTDSKDVMSRQAKFREEGVQPDPPKSRGFWGSKGKTQKLLDLIPSLSPRSKRVADLESAAAESFTRRSEDDTNISYSSTPDSHARSNLLPEPGRLAPEAPASRRRRKKGPKSLDRMAPITETSHDELRSAYRISEDTNELDIISEYEHGHPPLSAPLLRSHTESMLTPNYRFELSEHDLSPTDQVIEVEPQAEKEYALRPHPGAPVDFNKVKPQQTPVIHLRGPLQTVEDRLLAETERELEAIKAHLDEQEATRLDMDAKVAAMKVSHEKMKKEFTAATRGFDVHDESIHSHECDDSDDSDEDNDLVSICSSIDLDEEPTVHVAKAMTFTRVTPGMVKLVDIPPRKKKPLAPAVPSPSPTVSSESKPTYYFEHDDRISPFRERSENVEPTAMPGHLTAKNYNRLTKAKKAKMPRDESRLLVQDWISTYDYTKQRPVSERMDADVLADQQIPPAPFPKEALLTPPPRKSSKEHYCLKNGHIFHPIDLKSVPDEVSINSLEVRPYLRTSVGARQHVRVPVLCDSCSEDVKEELWECEIAVCRMGVCKKCAEFMEAEWQQRAVSSWQK